MKSHLYSYYKLDVAEVWWHLLRREVSILVHGQKRLEELARLKGDLCVLVRPNYELKCRVPHLIWCVLDKQEDVGAKIRFLELDAHKSPSLAQWRLYQWWGMHSCVVCAIMPLKFQIELQNSALGVHER